MRNFSKRAMSTFATMVSILISIINFKRFTIDLLRYFQSCLMRMCCTWVSNFKYYMYTNKHKKERKYESQGNILINGVAFPGTLTKIHGKSLEYLDNFPGILWDNLTLSMENLVHLSKKPGNSMEKPGTVPWTR